MREVRGHDLFFAHTEEGIIHRAVAAKIEDVAPTILGRRAEVRMLKQAGKGIAAITDIDPVAVGKLPIQRQHEAVCAIRLPPIVLRAVVIGQLWNQAAGEARGQRRDDAIKAPYPLIARHAPATINALNALNARSEQDLAPHFPDAPGQSFVQQLEAAAQVAQLRRAIMEARPEPGQRDLIVERAEFAEEKRLEEHAIGACTHPAAQPGIRRLPLQPCRWNYFEIRQHSGDAQAFMQAPRLEAQQRKRGVELMDLAANEADRARPQPLQPLTQPQFVDECDGRLIGAEEMMVELLQPGIADPKTGSQ